MNSDKLLSRERERTAEARRTNMLSLCRLVRELLTESDSAARREKATAIEELHAKYVAHRAGVNQRPSKNPGSSCATADARRPGADRSHAATRTGSAGKPTDRRSARRGAVGGASLEGKEDYS
jgi:hypothetical protein